MMNSPNDEASYGGGCAGGGGDSHDASCNQQQRQRQVKSRQRQDAVDDIDDDGDRLYYRRYRLLLRSKTISNNLFVRFTSSQQVQELHDEALLLQSFHHTENDHVDADDDPPHHHRRSHHVLRYWSIFGDQQQHGDGHDEKNHSHGRDTTTTTSRNTNIDFLPLEIKFESIRKKRRHLRRRRRMHDEAEDGDDFCQYDDNVDDGETTTTSTTTTTTTIYASYNGGTVTTILPDEVVEEIGQEETLLQQGGAASSSHGDPIIEIPSSLLSKMSSTSGRLQDASHEVDDEEHDEDAYWTTTKEEQQQQEQFVYVRALSSIVYATDVTLEPLTVEDWDLIDIYSEWFEQGGLLQQVSVIYINQILSLQVPRSPSSTSRTTASSRGAGDCDEAVTVHLKVKQFNSLNCPSQPSSKSKSKKSSKGSSDSSTNENYDTAWPDDDYQDATSDSESLEAGPTAAATRSSSQTPPPCALLIQDTEVIVIPRLRQRSGGKDKKEELKWSRPLRLIPCMDDYSPAMQHLAQEFQTYIESSNTSSSCGDRSSSRNNKNNGINVVDTATTNSIVPNVRQQSIVVHESILSSLQPRNKNYNIDKEENGSDFDDGEDSLWAWVMPCNNGRSTDHVDSANGTSETTKALVRVVTTSSEYLDKFDTALHPLIRFQLGIEENKQEREGGGLSLYWDFVRIQLLPKSRMLDMKRVRQEALPRWRLEHVRLVRNLHSMNNSSFLSQPWHVPDCCSNSAHPYETTDLEARIYVNTKHETTAKAQFLLQDGSLVLCPLMSPTIDNSGSNRLPYGVFMLVRRSEQHDSIGIGETVSLSMQDILFLQKQADSDRKTLNDDNCGVFTRDVDIIPASDSIVNLVPDVLALPPFLSPSWASTWTESFVWDLNHRVPFTLINGRKGTGKTYTALLMSILSRFHGQGRPLLYLDCRRLQQSSLTLSEMILQVQRLFEHAVRTRASTIVLDSLDDLAPNLLPSDGPSNEGSSNRVEMANPVALDQSKLVADRIIQLMQGVSRFAMYDSLGEKCSSLKVIATCESDDSIHPDIFRSGVCECRHIHVISSMPAEDRVHVLEKMLSNTIPFDEWTHVDQRRVGQLTEGFRPRDLEKLASIIGLLRRRQIRDGNLMDTVLTALEGFIPLSHMSLAESERNAKVSWAWSELGGMFRVKDKLTSTIIEPAKYRRIYEKAGIRLPRGVLLFGPPGCGKSVIVPALAKECNFPLITCKGPELLDKYIGASEAKVRELFNRALEVAPSILFLDELDALAPRRGSDHTGVTDRVVNQLLTFLDGVEDVSTSGGTLYIVAATSRPDKVDPALLRPGRLERHIFVGPAESDEEWTDLLFKMATSNQYKVDEAVKDAIASNEVARHIRTTIPYTKYFAAADFKAVLDTAHVCAVHDAIEATGSPEKIIDEIVIGLQQLELAFQSTKPSVSGDDARLLQNIYRRFHKTEGIHLFNEDDPEQTYTGSGAFTSYTGSGAFASRVTTFDDVTSPVYQELKTALK